ncbi:MAG: DciA family protein [Acidimicrobiales bacterium]
MTPGRSPGARGSDPRPLRESLDAVTRALGGPSASTLSALFSRWSELVGEDVAAHARPLSLRDGLLVVGADQSVWRTQLAYLEADLLARIAATVGPGVVSRIEVRVRPT